MKQTLFEQMGGTYRQEGGYLIPDLLLDNDEQRSVGIWGQRRKRYLKQYRKGFYNKLLLMGELEAHLEDIDEQAKALCSQLMEQHTKHEGITEQLKAENQMLWVQRMNNIRSRVEEEVCNELIYS